MAPAHLPLVILKGLNRTGSWLSGLNLVKSLLVANGQNNDVEIGLSDESISNGGSGASPQYNPTDPESSEDIDVGFRIVITQACTY